MLRRPRLLTAIALRPLLRALLAERDVIAFPRVVLLGAWLILWQALARHDLVDGCRKERQR